MRRTPLTGFLFVLGGCVGPASAEDLYMALGASWTVDPDSLCDSVGCGFDEVDEVRDVFAEVEGVVDVTDVGPTSFTMEAVASGDTLVTVIGLDQGSDVVERYAQAIVRPVSRFNFWTRCDGASPWEDPWIVPPGGELFAQWSLWDTEYNELVGTPEFELGAIEASELDSTHRDVVLKMPEEPGIIEIGSALHGDTIATFEVHEVGGFDGFEAEVWPEGALEVDSVKSLWTSMLVDGRRVCLDSEDRWAEVITPETCSFAKNEMVAEIERQGPTLYIYGHAEGECTVEVSVPAYGFSETVSMDVIALSEEPEEE